MHGKPPSSTAVGRAARLAGAAVQEIRELAGGTHAYTYLIRTAGPEQEFILREFPPGDDAARDEVRVLTALDGFDGLAPRLLAKGGGGNPSEGSWLLISRLPGAADIIPGQPATWAAQLGEALARVHATPMHRLTGFVSVFHRSRALLRRSADRRQAWSRLIGASYQRPAVLTHFDYWSGNTVWDGGRITGVVDWSGGCLGPRGFDVGWCRWDLCLLYGEDIADKFLGSYQKASKSAPPDILLWDLWAVARSHQHVESWVPNYGQRARRSDRWRTS